MWRTSIHYQVQIAIFSEESAMARSATCRWRPFIDFVWSLYCCCHTRGPVSLC